MERVRPAVVALVAPAGYGKSSFLNSVYGGRPDVIQVDCEGLRDDLDLARRLLPDLMPVLSDGSRTAADRLDFAVERFSSLTGRTFVFDGAQFIGRNQRAFEFFVRLLGKRPERSKTVVSSREALPFRLTRFAPPHDVLVFRPHDFAFDESEIRELFSPYVTDAVALRRIEEVTEGWPIALFLILRFAREYRLHAVLPNLDRAAFVELREYLADEVIRGFDHSAITSLFACASLQPARDADVRDAFPDALSGEHLAAFARESPFLHRADDATYRVHPLIAAYVLEHQEERRRLAVEQLALTRQAEGKYVDAAAFYLRAGNDAVAAASLARHDIMADVRPPAGYLELLERLSASDVQRYPHLWGMATAQRLCREPAEALFDEAQSVWRTIRPDARMRERYPIFVLRIMLMGYLGLLADARREIEALQREATGTGFQVQLALLEAYVRARSGELIAAQSLVDRAVGVEADMMAAFLYETLGAQIARPQGDRMELRFLQRAFERATSSGLRSARAMTVAQALVGAWLGGDEGRFAEARALLRGCIDEGFAGFSFLCASAERREATPSPADLPEFVVFALLIAVGEARDGRRRAVLARDAYALSHRLSIPFLVVLSSLAVALTDDSLFGEYLSRARSAAASIESAQLADAVERAATGASGGMLDAFIARIARDDAEIEAPVEVSIHQASVRIDGAPVELAGRELALLIAIALRPEATSRARLASLLWPDLDEDAARNALSVCLHRLRSRLPRKDAIERDGDGYRLHAQAAVDLWDLERALERRRKKGVLDERDRASLQRLWSRVQRVDSSPLERWEWFEDTARRLQEYRTTLAHLLGGDALARRDTSDALKFADAVLRLDACDEEAAEIAIRAQLAAGDRADAMRRYRQYRAALQAELGAEPSFSLTALVTTS